ncbi:MAG: HD domain-containing protein [Oscillospiraceae bacterium]|nr:HD domain-containing protein [Oscillospiraceae bacterium]
MQIKDIANLIKNAGGNLYLVGGAIRDEALGESVFDEDYCVTGVTADKFQELFTTAISRGKSFEVYDLEGKEFALARRDVKKGAGHKGFEIITGPEITIEEDLERRDITINSIAKEVLTGEIIDPFNGQEDIERKIIRANGRSFAEDPLRVYRVARFAAKLNFEVEKKTLEMMESLKGELDTLSKERVFTEIRKALKADKPSIFFNVLKDANVLDIHFKEIYDLIGSEQPIKHHPEGDSYNHTMLALDNSCELTDNEEIRFGTLVHDLGKGLTPKHMMPHHYGHENTGVDLVKALGKRVGLPRRWIKAGVTSCKEHMRGGKFFEMSVAKQVGFIERVDKSLLGIDGLQIVVYSDRCRRGGELIDPKYNFADVGKKMMKTINGEYMKQKYNHNIADGERFKSKLHQERIVWMKTRK